MIIETSDNRFFRVIPSELADIPQCWLGVEVKRVRGCLTRSGERVTEWVSKGRPPQLVRREASRVVEG